MTLSLDEIRRLVLEEESEDLDNVHLTSNETVLSPLAQTMMASPLGNRYLLEHADMRQDSPSRLNGFIYKGLNRVNAIERSAAEVCKELFAADYVEFRCLSGLHALQTTMASLTKPGDCIMRFGVADGGHFATETVIKVFGRRSCAYVFDRDRLTIDIEKTAEVFQREKPTLLYLDAMNYLFPFPIKELRAVVGDTPIVYDASHTLGLIAGGQFQNPLLEGADILQANTHKTFFGPQKGIILSRNRGLMERVSYHMSQGLVSSQHTASLLALCVALHETKEWGRTYAKQIVENAAFLADEMTARGLPVLRRSDGTATNNHHFFVNLTANQSASHAMEKLLYARLVVHRGIPFRNVDALRIGVQESTRRGYTKADYAEIAQWFAEILLHGRPPEEVAPLATAMARRHREIQYCDGRPLHEAGEVVPVIAPVRHDPAGRWVDFHRASNDANLSLQTVTTGHELGVCAASFPNQTDATGNISVRDGNDVIVTTSGCYIKDLEAKHFVRLLGVQNDVVAYAGEGVPSSESLMHYLIYQTTNAGAVVHTHYLLSDREAEDLHVAIIPPQEYASIALAQRVADACAQNPIVYVQKHGLIFHGVDAAACLGNIAGFIRYHEAHAHV